MRYVIWYGDGTTYRDADGPPDQAPKRNVLVIAQTDPDTGQSYVRGNDYYWWTAQGWSGGDIFGLFDYLIDPGTKIVLFGRTLPTRDYQAILRQAQTEDGYLPPKSGWHESEVRP